MKTSVMVFHPNIARSRINAALMERAQNEPELDLVVRDMYALYPDFHINVEEEQRVADGADRLVFQFPFYWYSAPALMKQWEDEVLSSGWAYGPDARIAGKRMMLAVSTGGLKDTYSVEGKHHAAMSELLLPYRIMAQYLGLEFEEPFIVHGAYAPDLDDGSLAAVAQEYVARLR